jgi:hypothetical protein
MSYFKTLLIDRSAARDYAQRWGGPQAPRPVAPEMPIMVGKVEVLDVPLTREAVGKALRQWRARVQHSPRDITALNRAALNIEATVWYWHDDTLIITSATSARTRYHVTATSCDCKAAKSGMICWHRWAWSLLDTARRPIASQKPVQRVTEDVQARVDDLF